MPHSREDKTVGNRKDEHLTICTKNQDITMDKSTFFEDFHLIPRALPDFDYNDVDTSTEFLGHKFNFPLLFSSLTGGSKKAAHINETLASIAEEFQVGIAVGSQKAALENPKLADSYKIVRKKAPTTFVAANIGAVNLNYGLTIENIKELIEMINADALFLHLNALQELIQPEGETNFSNLSKKIELVCKELSIPVIVKEVGCGISQEDAELLVNCNVDVIDIAGAGGTSWAKIEALRAKQKEKTIKSFLGETFSNWGLPTAISTLEVSQFIPSIKIISSGGIRNGKQAVKALVMGASLVGIGLPLLETLSKSGKQGLRTWLTRFFEEIKTTMFLIGVKTINNLQTAPYILTGFLKEWFAIRGSKIKENTQ
ncbi:MAG: type 2 isopentenyl-diphosphate Delta-isomerase [Asgard group archaeon]|nr:type 2 isopentenyl-diphosphate Delta-isomerase [Asgard group archaeon]